MFFSETGESVLLIKGPQGRINRAVWGPLNRTIISAGEDAVIRIWDSEVTSLPFYRTLFFPLQFVNIVTWFLSFLCRRENWLRSQTKNLAIKRQWHHLSSLRMVHTSLQALWTSLLGYQLFCFRDFFFLLILMFWFSLRVYFIFT